MIKTKYLKPIETIILITLVLIVFLLLFILIKMIVLFNISIDNDLSLKLVVKAIFLLLTIIFLRFILSYIQKEEVSNNIKKLAVSFETVVNKSKILTWTSAFLVLFIIYASVLIDIQNDLIYFPPRDNIFEESLLEGNNYEKINITIDDTVYSGWAKINEVPTTKTILYFGGNAQSSARFFYYYDVSNWVYFESYNVIYIDYPGYGLSTGSPEEDVNLEMSLIVFDYIIQLDYVDPQELVVMGYSLGTGVASYVSEQRDFNKLILIAPYSSMTDVINSNIPIIYGPLTALNKNTYDTLARTDNMNEDILIIASSDDDVIDIELSEKLIDELNGSTFYILSGYVHNNVINNAEAEGYIDTFLNE